MPWCGIRMRDLRLQFFGLRFFRLQFFGLRCFRLQLLRLQFFRLQLLLLKRISFMTLQTVRSHTAAPLYLSSFDKIQEIVYTIRIYIITPCI